MFSVSIIIATCSRGPALGETLRSLALADVPPDYTLELVIVENGARSGVKEMLASFPPVPWSLQHIFEPIAGKSRALNLGVTHARGEILLFTDDDIRFPKDWITQMCHPLTTGASVSVGGCTLAPHLERPWIRRYHRGFLGSTEYLSDSAPSEFAGGNWGCLRSVFKTVPRFDEELGGGGIGNGEDVLIARQLKHAGFEFASRTQVKVEHHPLESRLLYDGWLRIAASCGRGQAYTLHHWYHEEISFLAFKLLYVQTKLALRKQLTRHISPVEEGIPPWELSYRIDIARLTQFQIERIRPRNYHKLGFEKLTART